MMKETSILQGKWGLDTNVRFKLKEIDDYLLQTYPHFENLPEMHDTLGQFCECISGVRETVDLIMRLKGCTEEGAQGAALENIDSSCWASMLQNYEIKDKFLRAASEAVEAALWYTFYEALLDRVEVLDTKDGKVLLVRSAYGQVLFSFEVEQPIRKAFGEFCNSNLEMGEYYLVDKHGNRLAEHKVLS